MRPRPLIYMTSAVMISIGLIVLLLNSLSSARAAAKVSTTNTKRMNDYTDDQWRILADHRIGLGAPGVVALQNKIHVIGGYYTPGFGNSSDQGVYDPQTNTWEYMWGIFPKPRSDMVVANVGEKIFAIGGWNSTLESVYSYTHMYSPTLSEWITMTAMITPVSGAGGVVINDSIYVIGGFDGIRETSAMQIYDTIHDTWSIGTPLTIGRSELGAVVLDGLIYAIGGNKRDGFQNPSTDIVEIYDPVTENWSSGEPLPESRASMAVVERQGNIYVIGGTDNWATNNVTDTTFVFDPDSSIWSIGDPMPTARRAVGAAVISDTIYVIGGQGEPDAGTANEAYGQFEILPSTTRIISDNPDPSLTFQPFVISYVVTSSLDVPTGVVTVTSDLNTLHCRKPLVNGMGSCEIVLDTPGIYTITATYGGNDFHSGSSDSTEHLVLDFLRLYLPMVLRE